MTIQQIEYLLEVIRLGSFAKAATELRLTQPTLSMQIQKLEEECGIQLLDRSKRPITPSAAGQEFINQATITLREFRNLHSIIYSFNEEIKGEFKIGIIPTLAPYLIPVFAKKFSSRFPQVQLVLKEHTTEEITEHLKNESLDCALLAGPLQVNNIKEFELFNEPFTVYLSPKNSLLREKKIKAEQLKDNPIWLLEEGHCLRTQVLNICSFFNRKNKPPFSLNSGSLETLKTMVEENGGITFLPFLATLNLPVSQLARVRPFTEPKPVREICLAVNHNAAKRKIIHELIACIQSNLPQEIIALNKQQVNRIAITHKKGSR